MERVKGALGIMNIFMLILLVFLIITAIAASRSQDLLSSVIIFGGYSLMMAAIWQQLRVPDVALTEAIVGIIITVMFVALISKTRRTE